MISTVEDTITIKKILKAGEATSYTGKENQFHVLVRNNSIEKIITGIMGNDFIIIDATNTVNGSISIDIDLEPGYSKVGIYFAEDSDLDEGSVEFEKLGTGLVKKIINETLLEV